MNLVDITLFINEVKTPIIHLLTVIMSMLRRKRHVCSVATRRVVHKSRTEHHFKATNDYCILSNNDVTVVVTSPPVRDVTPVTAIDTPSRYGYYTVAANAIKACRRRHDV